MPGPVLESFQQLDRRVQRVQALAQPDARPRAHAAPGLRDPGGVAAVGRHHILTHCYWREAGPEFRSVNIMAVAHGTDKTLLLEHKRAIDRHLESCGIAVSYTNVFWGGRSEIKPSEISPDAYREWMCEMEGRDAALRRPPDGRSGAEEVDAAARRPYP